MNLVKNFNKEIGNIKMEIGKNRDRREHQSVMKNTITKMETISQRINRREDEAEDQSSI